MEICDHGRLVVSEAKIDDRPGQIEWIVEREAPGWAERAVDTGPVACVDAGHEPVTESRCLS